MGRIESTRANGPGNRAGVWLQGCDLGCGGCWSPESHAFDGTKDVDMFELADWVLSLKDIDGVAFSGGEPMQQAPSLMFVMDLIHKSRPSLSFNMYTGYSYRELEEGRFKWKSAYDARWIKGTEKLWGQIRQHLDFAIMGRFNERFVTIEKPLCGSLNQDVVFFNDRYSAKDLEKQVFEVTIKAGGENATLTGFPVGIDKTAFSR